MPTSCPECLAEFDKPRRPGSKCPECGARLPGERDEDDEVEDERPKRRKRRRDEDDDSDIDDRPARRRPAKKKSSVGKVLLILFGIAVGGVLLCCGGVYFLWPKSVKVLDATRTKTPDGGTASVTINVRVGSSGPGGMVRGDYYFNFKAGGRTSVHNVGLIGRDGGEFRSTFFTPELMKEQGSVEFWVERRDGSSVTRVSDYHTIP